MTGSKLTVRELCALAIMGALMEGAKVALAAVPNVHLNAVFIILAAVFFGWKAMYAVSVYIILEGLLFGFGLWWVSYLYAWPLLCAVCVLLRRNDSPLIWAVTAAVHGLLFGALCALPYAFIGGWSMAFSYWAAGLGFDLAHCAGNFVLTLVLYRPLKAAMTAVLAR